MDLKFGVTIAEKLMIAGYIALSAVLAYYIRKCDKLERQNSILEDNNECMCEYITECIDESEVFLDD